MLIDLTPTISNDYTRVNERDGQHFNPEPESGEVPAYGPILNGIHPILRTTQVLSVLSKPYEKLKIKTHLNIFFKTRIPHPDWQVCCHGNCSFTGTKINVCLQIYKCIFINMEMFTLREVTLMEGVSNFSAFCDKQK